MTPPRRRKPRKKWLAAGLVVGVLLVIAAGPITDIFKDGVPTLSKDGSSQKEKPMPPPVKKIDTKALGAEIDAVIAKYPGMQIGVSLTDIKTSDKADYGAEDTFRAASTTKLVTAALFLHQVEVGQRNLEQIVGGSPARAQLKLLIEKSDNAAWEAFDAILGGSALDEYAREIGMQTYTSARNRTTPADIALLLEKLYKGQLLNQENTDLLLSHMENASEQQYILAALPADTKAYHKVGYLTDRVHDGVIIDDGKRPFVLVIFSMGVNGQYSYIEGAQMMHEITNAVLAAYKNLSA